MLHLLPDVSPAHLATVLLNLSPEDRAELAAAKLPADPARFRDAIDKATVGGVVCRDAEPLAVFGCIPDPNFDSGGIPWMLATSSLRRERRAFLQMSRDVIAQMQARYAYLHNWCHCEHWFAIRWLSWLGFAFQPERVGPGGEFRHFEWCRDV